MKNTVGFSEGCEGISPRLRLSCSADCTRCQGQWGPHWRGGGWWWLIFGCEHVETLRGAEATPLAMQAGDGAGLLQQRECHRRRGWLLPCASSAWSRRRDGAARFSTWGWVFGSLLFRQGSLSPHGWWLPGRLKMPPLSHHLWPELSPLCQFQLTPLLATQWAWISLCYSVYKCTGFSKALGFMLELGQHFYLRYLNTLFWIQDTDLQYPGYVKNIPSPSKP